MYIEEKKQRDQRVEAAQAAVQIAAQAQIAASIARCEATLATIQANALSASLSIQPDREAQ